ncbi:MAG: VOC family protein [Candidatus Brachytrichaceae bacterium NZ_4S206]|jgi:catechol 2,3-dioxygenase
MSEPPIHPQTVIGHVHLKVSDLERAVKFYTEVLGFEVQQRWGDSAAFLSAGGYHHHIGLNTWESRGASPPPRRATGLYHFAVLYPNRKELARAFKRLLDHGWPIDGASDHGVSEAIYLRDPDGNGIEIYRDRPPEAWPHDRDGRLAMHNAPLDFAGLLAELDAEPS